MEADIHQMKRGQRANAEGLLHNNNHFDLTEVWSFCSTRPLFKNKA